MAILSIRVRQVSVCTLCVKVDMISLISYTDA